MLLFLVDLNKPIIARQSRESCDIALYHYEFDVWLFDVQQNRTEQNVFFCLSIYSLSQLQSYKMHGLLNIHIQFNNYSLDGITFTIVLEF